MWRIDAVFLLVAGCASPPMHPVTGDTGPATPSCDITVDSTVPADGATDAYIRQPIEFALSDADPTASVVADFAGTTSFRDDGRTMVYTPDAPLAPETAYQVGLDYCGGHPRIGFTTSVLGEPLDPNLDLVGRTFSLDFLAARFVGGADVENVLATYVSPEVLVSVVAVDDSGLHLRIALPQQNDLRAQDPCSRTVDLPPAAFDEAPYFVVQGYDVDLGTGGQPVILRSLHLTGTVAPDGSWMGGGTFDAVLDVRDVAALLGSTADDLCTVAAGLHVPCEACPQDGALYCVTAQADELSAQWLPDTTVVAIPSSPSTCLQ